MNDRFRFRAWVKEYGRFIERRLIDGHEASLTWEQCTGLKDKNGKLIYENDLLKDNNGIWQVKWNNEEVAFYIWNKKRDFYLSPFIGEYEIVGNINENPELLEEKAE